MDSLDILVGAVTPPGRLHRTLTAAARDAAPAARLVTLADFSLGFADGRPLAGREDDAARLVEVLSAAGGLIIASPVYHGWVPGALKNALDLVPRGALQGRRCGVVVQANDRGPAQVTADALRDILEYLGASPEAAPAILLDDDFDEGSPTAEAVGRIGALMARVTTG